MGWAQRANKNAWAKKFGQLQPKEKPKDRIRELREQRLQKLIDKTKPRR